MSLAPWSKEDMFDFRTSNARAQIVALEWMKNREWYPSGVEREEWIVILDKMIDGWQAVLDMDDFDMAGKFGSDFEDDCIRRFNEGMEVYREWYLALWD